MEKNKDKVKAGKAGAAATHKKRYEALVELSKLVNKNDLNWIQAKWKTKQIATLLGYIRQYEQPNKWHNLSGDT